MTRPPFGQATVEYSTVVWVLVVALLLGMTWKVGEGRTSAVDLLLESVGAFGRSVRYLAELPFP